MMEGKTIDARNWGAIAIDSNELDPEAQRQEFDKYSAQCSMQQELGLDYDSDEQRAALDCWRSVKGAQCCPKATVETVSSSDLSSDGGNQC